MPSFIANVDFDVYCAKCGAGLCSQSTAKGDYRGNNSLHIEPCERCIDAAKDEGLDEGYEKAKEEGA